ncbi:MAG: hypothetical protein AAF703_19665 [Cyanobacteria bacterium P01_D01_bin.105]
MISTLQTAPAITIDRALTGQRAQAFYRAALASIKVMVLLVTHLLGLTATALQALAKYYKEECHEGLLRWAQSEPDVETETTEAAIQSADVTVVNQTGSGETSSAETSAAPQLTAPAAAITISYKGFNSKMLRQLCEEFDVQWRNVHGKGKHLKVHEMKTRIDQAALASIKS